MKRILPLILIAAGAAMAEPLSMLYSGDNLWLPSAFLGQGTVETVANRIVGMTSTAGVVMVLFVLFSDAARLFLGKGIQIKDVFPFMGRHGVMAIIVSSSVVWGFVAKNVILLPCEAIINLVKGITQDQVMANYGEALMSASKASQEGIQSLLPTLFAQGVGSLLLAVLTAIALTISFAISLYISIMWTILFCIGPFFVPCVNFPALAPIGWSWLRTFLAFSIMGAVGSIAMAIVVNGGMLTNSIKLGATADLIPGLAYAAVVVVVMAMTPKLTLKLFEGTGADPIGVARTITSIAGTAASAAVLGAGVATGGAGALASTAGTAMKSAGALGGSLGVKGATALSEAGNSVKQFGSSASNYGKAIAKSQLPNLEKGAFPTFKSWGQSKKDNA